MPGANYMGGRRNAAKARARDADGRLEKNHFDRQRLAILGKGLGKTLAPDRLSRSRDLGPSGCITLAHARKSLEDTTGNLSTSTRFDSPAYSHLRSSPPRKRRRSNYQSSGTHSRRSSLLMELDSSEPISTRAAIARLLDQPDFAGLSRIGSMPRQEEMRRESSPDLMSSDENATSSHRAFAATSDGYSASRSCSPRYSSKPSSSGIEDDAGTASRPPASMARIGDMQNRDEEWEEDEFEAMTFDDDDENMSANARDDSGFAERLENQHCLTQPSLYSHGRSSTSSSSLPRSSIPSYDIPCYENPSSDSAASASDQSLAWHQPTLGASLHDSAIPAGGSCIDVYEQTSFSPVQMSRSETSSSVEHSLRLRRSLEHLSPETVFWDWEAQNTSKLDSSGDSSVLPYHISDHSVDEETLGDVLSGRLFGDADPLLAIRARLGLNSPHKPANSDLARNNVLIPSSPGQVLPEDDAIAAASVVEVLTRTLKAPLLETSFAYDLAYLPRAPSEDPDINNKSATDVAVDREDSSLDTLLANYILLDSPVPPSAVIVEPHLQSPSPIVSAPARVDPSPAFSLQQLVVAHRQEPANPPHGAAHEPAAPPCAEPAPEQTSNIANTLGHEAPAQGTAIEAESCIAEPTPVKVIVGPTLFADDDGSDE